VRLLNPQGLASVAAGTKRALALLSPHFNLARGLYDVHASYQSGEGARARGRKGVKGRGQAMGRGGRALT
jgi:hypothetical protein